MKIEKTTRPCIVSFGRYSGRIKKYRAEFYGVYQLSNLTGSKPIAVIEHNGKLKEVNVNQVEFDDVVKLDPVEEFDVDKFGMRKCKENFNI